MKITCRSCQNTLSENAIFCGKCGTRQKCSSCSERLSLNAKFCEACGAKVEDLNTSTESTAKNKIIYKEDAQGRTFEAEFTDHVGKDITDSWGKILIAKQLTSGTGSNSDINKESNIDLEDAEIQEVEEVISEKENSQMDQLPSLETVALKNLGNSESEWIVVYAFYMLQQGKKTFTRQDVIDIYEKTKRKTTVRMKNLSAYITAVVKADYISKLNETDYSILEKGINKAKEVISRTSSSSSKPQKSATKKAPTKSVKTPKSNTKSKTSAKSIIQEKFDAHSKKKTLKQLFDEKQPGSNTGKRILTIAYYLSNFLGFESFSDGNIDYAYRALKLDKRPKHLRQQITNFKNNNAWFEEAEDGKWRLSRNGEIYVEDNFA
tara:strand:- start:137 stop:1270 length:1134 start_codon:yes stop_codon:yes gene_type:complete